jgi:hypothetical protein
MPDNAGSNNASNTFTTAAAAPATSGKAAPTPSVNDGGWKDASQTVSEDQLVFSDGADAGENDDPEIAALLGESGVDADPSATDVIDGIDPMGSDAPADTETVAEKPADEFDPTKIREARESEAAAMALMDSGLDAEEVKALYKTNKGLFFKLARQAQAGSKTDAPAKEASAEATPTSPFDPIFEQASKSLAEAYGEDSAEAKAIIGTLRPIVDQIQKVMSESITGVKGEYTNALGGLGNNMLRVETENVAARLAKDWPKLDTDDGFTAAVSKMAELVKGGEKFPSVRAALQRAATDLWSKEKEVVRRQAMTREAKAQSQGQPSLKTSQGPTTTAAKQIDPEKYEKAIFKLLETHGDDRDSREKAVADFKRRYVPAKR